MSNTQPLSTRDVARALGTNVRAVSRLVSSGELSPSVVAPGGPHGTFLFDPDEVAALAQRRAQRTGATV